MSLSDSGDAESVLMQMANQRGPLQQLFYPSLEAEVVGPYMASRRRHYTDAQWIQLVYGMHTSNTLYVGNLSFYTREEQIHELFSRVAPVRRVIMGLNSNTRTPCGFAFVEHYTHAGASAAASILNGFKLDDRIIKADLDAAFEEGRQYGRGRSGGQITDDLRADFDLARGGWGTLQQLRKERAEAAEAIKAAQLDTFGQEEEQYDPETYGGGYERPSNTSSIFNIDRPLKLSAATIAACTPSVFPYYGLPLDERVQKALADHMASLQPPSTADSVAAATSAAPSTAAAHAPPAAATNLSAAATAIPSKRPLSPDNDLTPPPSPRHGAYGDDGGFTPEPSYNHHSDDDAASPSHATKRARHTSPQPRSPQPRSPQPRSPQPRSPQPRYPTSPQPIYASAATAANNDRHYHDDLDDHQSTPRSSRYDDYDNDRTPSRHSDDDDRTPTHLSDVDDDRTPQHLDDDPDRTPQHLSPEHPTHAMQVDDDATPQPEENDRTEQPVNDFEAFEK